MSLPQSNDPRQLLAYLKTTRTAGLSWAEVREEGVRAFNRDAVSLVLHQLGGLASLKAAFHMIGNDGQVNLPPRHAMAAGFLFFANKPVHPTTMFSDGSLGLSGVEIGNRISHESGSAEWSFRFGKTRDTDFDYEHLIDICLVEGAEVDGSGDRWYVTAEGLQSSCWKALERGTLANVRTETLEPDPAAPGKQVRITTEGEMDDLGVTGANIPEDQIAFLLETYGAIDVVNQDGVPLRLSFDMDGESLIAMPVSKDLALESTDRAGANAQSETTATLSSVVAAAAANKVGGSRFVEVTVPASYNDEVDVLSEHIEEVSHSSPVSREALERRIEALTRMLAQAAVPGGISQHEFSRPGGWLERTQALLAEGNSTAPANQPLPFTVLGCVEGTGKLFMHRVYASDAYNSFAVVANDHPDAEFTVAIAGHLDADVDLTFPGESVVCASTVLEQPDVFGEVSNSQTGAFDM